MQNYQVAIIGSGAGGARAALMAARKGFSVALIESHLLGGVCLHEGCLPIKCLSASEKMHRRVQNSSRYGVESEIVSSYLHDWVGRQRLILTRLSEDLEYDLAKAGVKRIHGRAAFRDAYTLDIISEHFNTEIRAENIIIATGLRSAVPQYPRHPRIGDHRIFLKMLEAPKDVIIVGGGFTGCEFASILNSLGTHVMLVEGGARLVPTLDASASDYLVRDFEARGISVLLGSEAAIMLSDDQPSVLVGGKVLHSEFVLVTGQRHVQLDGLGLDNAGVVTMPDRIPTNEFMQTSQPHIYAVGDVNGITPQAHAAIAQGETAVYHLAGEARPYNASNVPQCVYTYPEIAQVGVTESDAEAAGLNTISATVEFRAVAKAMAIGESEGFVKLTAARATGALLGGVIVGSMASELVSQISTILKFKGTAADLAEIAMPYPTFSQALRKCAWRLRG